MPKSDTWFTPANAKEMSARAHEARWHAPKIQDCRNTVEQSEPELPVDTFRAEMLANVRGKIKTILEAIDGQLEAKALDSKVLKELTDALYRFEAMEQKLSGRAGPGSMKPTQSRQSSRKVTSAAEVFANDPVTPGPLPAPPAPAPASDPNAPNG